MLYGTQVSCHVPFLTIEKQTHSFEIVKQNQSKHEIGRDI